MAAAGQLAGARKEIRRRGSRQRKLRRAASGGDPQAILRLAVEYFSDGKLDAAERALRPLASKGNERAMLNLAAIEHQQGGTFSLDDLAETEDPHVALGVIELAVATGQLEVARRCLSRQNSAGLIDGLTSLGVSLRARGLSDEAVWVLEQAATAECDDVARGRDGAAGGGHDAQALLGELLIHLGREDKAEPWLQLAAEAGLPGAEYNLGLVLKHQGKPADAEHWYRRAASHGYQDAQYNLALLLLEQDRASEAEEWLRKSAEAGDRDGENALGALLMGRGDEANAEALFRSAASEGHHGAWVSLRDPAHAARTNRRGPAVVAAPART